jgi:hypothetical protein
MSDTDPKYGSAPAETGSSGTGWTYGGNTYTIGAGGTYLVRGSTLTDSGNNGNRLVVADYVRATVMLDNAVIDTVDNQHAAITLGDNAVLTVYGVGTVSGISGGSVDLTGAHLTLLGDLADTALKLGNSSTLTVNSTVNASGGGIVAASDSAAPATLTGSGNIKLSSNGSLITIPAGKKLILDGDVTLKGRKIDPDGADNNASLVVVNGALEMKGGVITGNADNNGDGGGVWVSGAPGAPAVFTMTGGEISGNSDSMAGGGVQVIDHGSFTMSGGEISNNTAAYYGGAGVAVWGGEFTLNAGGTISHNIAGRQGGGVLVTEYSKFTMNGGAISHNSTSTTPSQWNPHLIYSGGGVYAGKYAVFTMLGGTISGNHSAGHGGGVSILDNAAFTMSGGTIYGSGEGGNSNTYSTYTNLGNGATMDSLSAALFCSGGSASAKYGDETQIGTDPGVGSGCRTSNTTLTGAYVRQ